MTKTEPSIFQYALIVIIILAMYSCNMTVDTTVNENTLAEIDVINTVSLVGKRGMKKHSYDTLHPFQNAYLTLPKNYKKQSFELKHDYPDELPADEVIFPWKSVTNNGPIDVSNSQKYVEVLKEYVSGDMRKLLYSTTDVTIPWWQSIWLGSQREPIHGMYVGSPFPTGTLATDQDSLTTFVYTLYDATAAVTLNKIWGTDLAGAEKPNLNSATNVQFAEGSVIIKFAFVTATTWPAMQGAALWTVYTDVDAATGNIGKKPPRMADLALMQFDIIVKDSQASPETGWVFSTLVYDKDAPGNDAWDKMVPLGATWGNNPTVINTSADALNAPVTVNTKLTENWINMQAPKYSRSTLGWDGRLSGPNDGAVVDDAYVLDGRRFHALSTVGCLGCHSSAQYKFNSFLLPTVGIPSNSNPFIITNPGSKTWMRWFQNRDGETPMDLGPGENQIGLDYDMVTAFKAIPLWETAMKDKAKKSSSN